MFKSSVTEHFNQLSSVEIDEITLEGEALNIESIYKFSTLSVKRLFAIEFSNPMFKLNTITIKSVSCL